MNKEMKLYTRIALVIATFVALLHALWALLVGIGVAQTYLDWILPMHFISNIFSVLTFNWMTAIFLVIISFIGSYLAVLLFIVIWKMIKIK